MGIVSSITNYFTSLSVSPQFGHKKLTFVYANKFKIARVKPEGSLGAYMQQSGEELGGLWGDIKTQADNFAKGKAMKNPLAQEEVTGLMEDFTIDATSNLGQGITIASPTKTSAGAQEHSTGRISKLMTMNITGQIEIKKLPLAYKYASPDVWFYVVSDKGLKGTNQNMLAMSPLSSLFEITSLFVRDSGNRNSVDVDITIQEVRLFSEFVTENVDKFTKVVSKAKSNATKAGVKQDGEVIHGRKNVTGALGGVGDALKN